MRKLKIRSKKSEDGSITSRDLGKVEEMAKEQAIDELAKVDRKKILNVKSRSKIKWKLVNILVAIGLFFVKVAAMITIPKESSYAERTKKILEASEVISEAFDDFNNEHEDYIEERINLVCDGEQKCQ
jgi:hypothetical protein